MHTRSLREQQTVFAEVRVADRETLARLDVRCLVTEAQTENVHQFPMWKKLSAPSVVSATVKAATASHATRRELIRCVLRMIRIAP